MDNAENMSFISLSLMLADKIYLKTKLFSKVTFSSKTLISPQLNNNQNETMETKFSDALQKLSETTLSEFSIHHRIDIYIHYSNTSLKYNNLLQNTRSD